jgi:SAM-dependent MidA family methyltransferase
VDEHKMGERFKVMTILPPKSPLGASNIGFPSN